MPSVNAKNSCGLGNQQPSPCKYSDGIFWGWFRDHPLWSRALEGSKRMARQPLAYPTFLGKDVVMIWSDLQGNLQRALGIGGPVTNSDEIDKALKMQGDSESAGGVGTRILGDLLTWMQEKTEPVVVVATCNDVKGLSSALLRKGRFDEIFFVDLPGPTALKAILDIHLQKRGRDPGKFSTESLVGSAAGLVGAEVEAAIEDALFTAYGEEREVTTNDINTALGTVIPYSLMQYDEATALRTWAKQNARPASAETVDLREVLESRKSSGTKSRRALRISMVEKEAEKPR